MDTPDITNGVPDPDKQQAQDNPLENGLTFGPTDPEIHEMRKKYAEALAQEFQREQELDPDDTLRARLMILSQMSRSTHVSSFARTCQMRQLRSFGCLPTLPLIPFVCELPRSS